MKIDTLKVTWKKKSIQERAEAVGNLIGNINEDSIAKTASQNAAGKSITKYSSR